MRICSRPSGSGEAAFAAVYGALCVLLIVGGLLAWSAVAGCAVGRTADKRDVVGITVGGSIAGDAAALGAGVGEAVGGLWGPAGAAVGRAAGDNAGKLLAVAGIGAAAHYRGRHTERKGAKA